ncbi:hypothetical protein BC937DRAFT_91313 [Endogone sp. FLAS-F59071]|nr:hypothetical protein BC937DRAFT_91313 [Endogone sp. FLAS-F59071]|eukprot:RUS16352.1 hypothetical protein BC937DRAFT_91313 [Endogone sp. FLAS-F59071]
MSQTSRTQGPIAESNTVSTAKLPILPDLLTPVKKRLLDAQLVASGYLSRSPPPAPTRLDVYDFDGTLFASPFPNPKLWDAMLIGALMVEDVLGSGWWRDLASLDLGEKDKLRKTGWEGWWREDIVSLVRDSMEDADTMTVLLTGRRYHPFHAIVPEILSAKGLQFDLLGLRPDPKVPDGGSDVLGVTVEFKLAFLTNLLLTFPTLREVRMWEDRAPHVEKFEKFLKVWEEEGRLAGVEVHYVPEATNRMEEEWELGVIKGILEKHNEKVEARGQDTKKGVKAGKEPIGVAEEEEMGAQDGLSLAKFAGGAFSALEKIKSSKVELDVIPQFTAILLDRESVRTLLGIMLPLCTPPLSTDTANNGTWKLGHADQVVVCAGKATENELSMLGGIGATVKMRVTAIGQWRSRVWAAAVEGLDPNPKAPLAGRLVSRNKYAHITLAYNPAAGGKRAEGHHVTDWKLVPETVNVTLTGTVFMHNALGIGSMQRPMQQEKKEVSIGRLVMVCHPEFKGAAIGRACAEVAKEMERRGVANEAGNEEAIEAIVRGIVLE